MPLYISFFPPLYFAKRARRRRRRRRCFRCLRYFIIIPTTMNTIPIVINRDIEIALDEGGNNIRPLRETVNQAACVHRSCLFPIPRRIFVFVFLSFYRRLRTWRTLRSFTMQFIHIFFFFFSALLSIYSLSAHRVSLTFSFIIRWLYSFLSSSFIWVLVVIFRRILTTL